VLLTNQFSLEATAIGQLYRDRWRIEIFFRWIKQHLRIKAFYGRTPNAVLVQVWIAVSVYVLIAILKNAPWPTSQPVRSSTDSWHHIVRENPAGMRPAARKLPKRRERTW
jgi:IS4 transposase